MLQPRTARPDAGASARLLAAHGCLTSSPASSAPDPAPAVCAAQNAQRKFRIQPLPAERPRFSSAYCACQRCRVSCGTVANSGRVVSSRGKVEKFCVAKRTAPREPWLASWRSLHRGRFRDRPPSHVPVRQSRSPTADRGRGFAAASQGGDSMDITGSLTISHDSVC